MRQRSIRAAAVAGLLAAGLAWHAAPVRSATDADATNCTMSGSAAWGSTVTATPDTHVYSFPLAWSCSGTTDDSGTQQINFIGVAAENCYSGSGTADNTTGTVEGSPINAATIAMSQQGNQFSFSGTVTTQNGETHHVSATVTVDNPNTLLCPYAASHSYPASGSGTLSDT